MKKGNFFSKNWMLILVVVYILSPLDLIPDALPVAGAVDDFLLLAIELVRRYKASQAEEKALGEEKALEIEDKK